MQQEYVRIGTGVEELFPVPATADAFWQLQSMAGAPITYATEGPPGPLPHLGRKVDGGILLPPIRRGMRYKLVLGSHEGKRVA
jgi:hypothetical protein